MLRELRTRTGSLCNDDNPDRLCDRAVFVHWCKCLALVAVGAVVVWFFIFVLVPLCGIAWMRISDAPLSFMTDHICNASASNHDIIAACVYTPMQKCACQLDGIVFIVLLCCGFFIGYFAYLAASAIYRALYCYREQRRTLVTDAWPDDEHEMQSLVDRGNAIEKGDIEIPNVLAFMFDERNPHALGSLNDHCLRIKGLVFILTAVGVALFLIWFVGAILVPLLGYALCSGGATKTCNVSNVALLMYECTHQWGSGCQCFREGWLLLALIVMLLLGLVAGIVLLVRMYRSAKTPQEMTALHGNQLGQQQQYGACPHYDDNKQ